MLDIWRKDPDGRSRKPSLPSPRYILLLQSCFSCSQERDAATGSWASLFFKNGTALGSGDGVAAKDKASCSRGTNQ